MALEPGIAPTGEPQSFDEYLLRVNPTKAALKNLKEQVDETPVIMLNLLRFRPRNDPTIYAMYGKEAAPEVEKVKSYVGFFGLALTDMDPAFGLSNDWDGVVLPVYRRRAAFLELQRSPIYQRAIPLRTAGTYARLLYVLRDSDTFKPAQPSISKLNESRGSISPFVGGCVLIELGSGHRDIGGYVDDLGNALAEFDGRLCLSTKCEVPVVSEKIWNYCQISAFPTKESLSRYLGSARAGDLKRRRKNLFDDSLLVAAKSVEVPS